MGKHGSLEAEGKIHLLDQIVKGGKEALGLADGFGGHGMGRAWLK
jgi:hypothetical protein